MICGVDRDSGDLLRWLRALLVSVVAMAGGVAAHTTAHGRLPNILALLAIFNILLLVQVAWLGRPATPARITALMLGGQTFVHLALTLSSGHTEAAVAEPASPIGHLVADLSPASLPMMGLHLAAGAVVGLWLAIGETALWTVIALTGTVLARLVLAPSIVLPRLRRPLGITVVAVRTTAARGLDRAVTRRGPPLLFAA